MRFRSPSVPRASFFGCIALWFFNPLSAMGRKRALAVTIFGRATLIFPSCDGPFAWIVRVFAAVGHVEPTFGVSPRLNGR